MPSPIRPVAAGQGLPASPSSNAPSTIASYRKRWNGCPGRGLGGSWRGPPRDETRPRSESCQPHIRKGGFGRACPWGRPAGKGRRGWILRLQRSGFRTGGVRGWSRLGNPTRETRIELHGSLELGLAFGFSAGFFQQETQIQVGRPVLWVDGDHPSVELLGLRVVPGGFPHDGKVVKWALEVWVDSDRATIIGLGKRVITSILRYDSEIEIGELILGIVLQHLLVGGRSFVQPARELCGKAFAECGGCLMCRAAPVGSDHQHNGHSGANEKHRHDRGPEAFAAFPFARLHEVTRGRLPRLCTQYGIGVLKDI